MNRSSLRLVRVVGFVLAGGGATVFVAWGIALSISARSQQPFEASDYISDSSGPSRALSIADDAWLIANVMRGVGRIEVIGKWNQADWIEFVGVAGSIETPTKQMVKAIPTFARCVPDGLLQRGTAEVYSLATGWPWPALWYHVEIDRSGAADRVRGGIVLGGDGVDYFGRTLPHIMPVLPLWVGFIGDVCFWSISLFIATAVASGARAHCRRHLGRCAACGHQLVEPPFCPECGSHASLSSHSKRPLSRSP